MIDQLEPTRRSARVAIPTLGLGTTNDPTAKHTRTSGHDTPANEVEPAPAGLGADCWPHELTRPNQRSTRGEKLVPPDVGKVTDLPTAVQVRLRGHETATSSSSCEAVGSGVD